MAMKTPRNTKAITYPKERDIRMACKIGFNQQHQQQRRRFLFSSISSDLEESLQHKIESLDGKTVFHGENSFSSLYTHVIAKDFTTTEKILGALAGGKWLLTPDYIEHSYRKGYWLNEEDYEFSEHNKVASYHRCKRELRRCGLYDGWKILVLMESPKISRIYRRILTAGGAEIASSQDLTGIDFVITTEKLIKSTEVLVGGFVPLVDNNYIRNTLVFRHDPSDLKTCDLRELLHQETLRKSSTPCARQGGHTSSKEPATPLTETVLSKKKQSVIKPKPSPVTPKPNELPLNRKLFEERKGDRTTSEIKRIKRDPPPPSPPSLNNTPYEESENENTTIEDDNHSITNSLPSFSPYSSLPSTPKRTAILHNVQSEPEITIKRKNRNRRLTRHMATRYDTEIKPVGMKSVPPSWKNCYVTLGSRIPYMRCHDQRDKDGQMFHRFRKLNIKSKQFEGIETERETSIRKQNIRSSKQFEGGETECETPIRKQNIKSKQFETGETEHKTSIRTGTLRNTTTETASQNSVDGTTDSSSETLNKPCTGPMYSLSHHHTKEAILTFLRTRKYLRDGYCTTLLIPPVGNERNSSIVSDSEPQQSTSVTPEHETTADEARELMAPEMHFYSSCVGFHDEELYVNGLDILLDQVSANRYPPPDVLGNLLKEMVLETPYHIVHARALRVLYKVLTFHAPRNTQMRKYYLRVLELAMQPNTSGNCIAWQFIQSVIESAMGKEPEEPQPSEDLQDKMMFSRSERAHHVLEFLGVLITEDKKDCAHGSAVHDLLTWEVFWGYSKTCIVLPSPIKRLLQLWMSQRTSPSVRFHLSHLVTLVFEVMWKFSGHALIPVTTLPDTLTTVKREVGILIKGSSSEHILAVMRSLPNPWIQAVVSFMMLQEVTHYPKEMHLSTIVDFFISISENPDTNTVAKPVSPKKVHNNVSVNLDAVPQTVKRSMARVNKRNQKGETALLVACVKNDVERVRQLLKEPGVDVNQSDHCGWTPLHEAAIRGHTTCIKLILNHTVVTYKRTLDSYFKKGNSSLLSSLYAGDLEESRIPLHDAVIENQLESVKLLLDYGGEELLRVRTKDGKTPFDLASSEEMLRLLNWFKKSADCTSTSVISKEQEFHKELLLTLGNTYLEVSGFRYMRHMINRSVYQALKNTRQVINTRSSDTNDKQEATDETVNNNVITKKYEPLNLVENERLETISELEEIVVAEIYKTFKVDRKVRRTQGGASMKDAHVRHLFKVLWS